MQVFEQNFPEEIIKLEKILLIYIGENDLKNLKTEIPDEWKSFTET